MTRHGQTPADRIQKARIIAVVSLDEPKDAAPLVQALLEGGITAVELTLRGEHALAALRAMREAGPTLLIGAGTVLTRGQAEAARETGADFALAPGFDSGVVQHCAKIGLPFVPGVATASDIQAAVAAGCQLLKFFPAEPLGGVRGLCILAAPFVHLGVRFLPLGGIDAATAPAYLAESIVAAVGGSWIAPADLIRQHDWVEIRQRAARAATHATGLGRLSA